MGYKQHDTDDPRQKWEEFAAMHVTPVRCDPFVPMTWYLACDLRFAHW